MGLANARRTEGHEDRARLRVRGPPRQRFDQSVPRRVRVAERGGSAREPRARAHVRIHDRDGLLTRCPLQRAPAPWLVPPGSGSTRTVTFWTETRPPFARQEGTAEYLACFCDLAGSRFTSSTSRGAGAGPTAERSTVPHPRRRRPGSLGSRQVPLDPEAKEAYRRRLAEIEEDIDGAEAMGDAERAEQAVNEREFLARELARAVGLGGRDRRASSASERARASVTRAVRDAMARIHEHHPPLGEHLERTVRTGTYCVYLPDSRRLPDGGREPREVAGAVAVFSIRLTQTDRMELVEGGGPHRLGRFYEFSPVSDDAVIAPRERLLDKAG